jgi:recombination protein RecR
MPSFSPLIDQLIQVLRCLPGVGPKSAQRMAFYLLQRHRDQGMQLAECLKKSMIEVGQCELCRNFSEQNICRLCQLPSRDNKQLCVVESPSDVYTLEQIGCFRGYYFVLMGHLSPLDGIGPEQLNINLLVQRIQASAIQEIILATNPTVEGEATSHYLYELLKPLNVRVTRLAHGIPVGGELEFVDGNTLSRAFERRELL